MDHGSKLSLEHLSRNFATRHSCDSRHPSQLPRWRYSTMWLLPLPGCSRLKISGRAKSLWNTATSASGKVLTSEKTYVTSC